MRWYEEMIVAQAKLNPLTRRQDERNADRPDRGATFGLEASTRELKNTRSSLGLEANSVGELDRYLADRSDSGSQTAIRVYFQECDRPG
jgi:hypothetical protein